MKRWGGTDRRAGSRPAAFRLAAVAAYPEERNKGIGSDHRAGSRPAAFRLAAIAAYPKERETPGKNSQPAADRPPRAFPILPAARNKGIGTVRRAGSRPCGLSLSGCRRISGRTGKTSGKYPALRAGCFPAASPVLPAARLVALEKSCH